MLLLNTDYSFDHSAFVPKLLRLQCPFHKPLSSISSSSTSESSLNCIFQPSLYQLHPSPPPQSQTSKRDSSRLQLLDSQTYRTPQLYPSLSAQEAPKLLTPTRKTLHSQAPSILSNQSLHLHPTSDCFTRLISAQDTDSSSLVESAAIVNLLRTFR
ncbi:hypothetical protein PGT21_028936 [Puccinia graminis f. sp. tritici]|uniref:Uncharacterized protein n=1 Tax=Puccinia graminis f. sp. tritici TaxID=56615 RepID=A0A5B0MQ98_PUCGR|nr:hypothetical protein PGT21_028936 [Puccinia graminis f. sp. tritici]